MASLVLLISEILHPEHADLVTLMPVSGGFVKHSENSVKGLMGKVVIRSSKGRSSPEKKDVGVAVEEEEELPEMRVSVEAIWP